MNRFIPACAGNRTRPSRHDRSRTVHPRVCGEQLSSGRGSSCISGSSPRVRGTEPALARNCSILRFIPACAGNRDTTIFCR